MDFLKQVLGDSFVDFSERIAQYNQSHPERMMKLANLADGNYVSKAKFADLEAREKQLRQQVSAMQEDGGESLSEQLSALQKKYDDETKRLMGEVHEAKFNGAVDLALQKSGARNAKAVRALLDLSQVEFKDGALVGLDAQLDEIRQENGFLFQSGVVSTGLRQGGTPAAIDGFVSAAREAAGLN